jgi:transcriptional regulator with XRE-family HTH domain
MLRHMRSVPGEPPFFALGRARGLRTRQALAEHVGLSVAMLDKLRAGERRPGAATIERVLLAFPGYSYIELFGDPAARRQEVAA